MFFDRVDSCFTEALAWIPQSTVALATYHGALQLEAKYWPHQREPGWRPAGARDYAGVLLQTHDSVNFQFPSAGAPAPAEIQKTLEKTIPYDDPLVIPWELKQSKTSWGEMTKCQ